MPVMQDIYAMTVQDVKNQYTGVGKQPTAGTAFLAIELLRRNGQPLTGIPITGIQLLDANNQPVLAGSAYFFNAQGALDGSAGSAVLGPGGHSRAAILDVLPGPVHAGGHVSRRPGQPAGQHDGRHGRGRRHDRAEQLRRWRRLRLGQRLGLGSGSGSGSGGAPTFATDIYPRLQRAGAGGLGCANCHTANGTAAILPYDDAPATVLANIKAITGVVDLATPASSLFLTKPLYEPTPPQNHPNATFLDTNDPDYIKFLAWITAGAN